jgi:hypothetical protein
MSWLSRCGALAVAFAFVAGAAAQTTTANAKAGAAKGAAGFSFVAYGDSRSMMYLPYTKADTAKIHAALVRLFSLILGERVAEAIVQKDVKLSFDPKNGALTGVDRLTARHRRVYCDCCRESPPMLQYLHC